MEITNSNMKITYWREIGVQTCVVDQGEPKGQPCHIGNGSRAPGGGPMWPFALVFCLRCFAARAWLSDGTFVIVGSYQDLNGGFPHTIFFGNLFLLFKMTNRKITKSYWWQNTSEQDTNFIYSLGACLQWWKFKLMKSKSNTTYNELRKTNINLRASNLKT